jgi:hypothetical protein
MALVRILVDGYSLLHNWPELAPGQPRHSAAARDELIHVLTRYQDAIRTPITIVFDGGGAPAGAPRPTPPRNWKSFTPARARQPTTSLSAWPAASGTLAKPSPSPMTTPNATPFSPGRPGHELPEFHPAMSKRSLRPADAGHHPAQPPRTREIQGRQKMRAETILPPNLSGLLARLFAPGAFASCYWIPSAAQPPPPQKETSFPLRHQHLRRHAPRNQRRPAGRPLGFLQSSACKPRCATATPSASGPTTTSCTPPISPCRVWSKRKQDEIAASKWMQFLAGRRYQNRPHLEKVLPAVRQTVAASRVLTVIFIYDGSETDAGQRLRPGHQRPPATIWPPDARQQPPLRHPPGRLERQAHRFQRQHARENLHAADRRSAPAARHQRPARLRGGRPAAAAPAPSSSSRPSPPRAWKSY